MSPVTILISLWSSSCGAAPPSSRALPVVDLAPQPAVSTGRALVLDEGVAIPPSAPLEWRLDERVLMVKVHGTYSKLLVDLDTGEPIGRPREHNGGTLGALAWVYKAGRPWYAEDVYTFDGGERELSARLPSGEVVPAIRVLPHPTERRLHVYAVDLGGEDPARVWLYNKPVKAYGGVWTGGDDPVAVPHPVPFLPDMVDDDPDHAYATAFRLVSGDARGCVRLTLPADGRSECLTREPFLAREQIEVGETLILQMPGSPPRRGDGRALFPAGVCPGGRMQMSWQARAAFGCDDGVAVWSRDTVWTAAASAFERPPVFDAGIGAEVHVGPIVADWKYTDLGDAFEQSQERLEHGTVRLRDRWLSLVAPALFRTPPLRAAAAPRTAAWDDEGNLYWLDLTDQGELRHLGKPPCAGRLGSGNVPEAATCRDASGAVSATYLVGERGWWTTTRHLYAVGNGKLYLTDAPPVVTGVQRGRSTRLWRIDDPR